jgi:hypothetical protein
MNNELNALKVLEGNSKRSSHTNSLWNQVDKSDFLYNGIYYPDGLEIFVKKFTAGDLSFFSSLEFHKEVKTDQQLVSQLQSLTKMFLYIAKNCVDIRQNGSAIKGGGVHLFAHDKMQIAMIVRKYSPNIKTPLEYTNECNECGETSSYVFDTKTAISKQSPLEKYYDGENFKISNDSFSKQWIYEPMSISEEQKLNDFAMKLVQKKKVATEKVQTFIKFFPFLRTEKIESINEYYKKFRMLTASDFEELNYLVNHSLQSETEVTVECNSCFHKQPSPANIKDWKQFYKQSDRTFTL